MRSSRRSFLGLMALLPFTTPAVVKAASAPSAPDVISTPAFRISTVNGLSKLEIHGSLIASSEIAPGRLSVSDLAFPPPLPQADNASAAVSASMSPKVGADAAAPHSNPTLQGVASVTSAAPALSPPVPQVGLGAADFSSSNSVVEHSGSARQPSLGVSSLDLPAASSGVAGLSPELIGDTDDEIDALISALEAGGTFDCIKNAMTFRVAAASEIISNSTSSVGA